jgi:hypothetical protein
VEGVKKLSTTVVWVLAVAAPVWACQECLVFELSSGSARAVSVKGEPITGAKVRFQQAIKRSGDRPHVLSCLYSFDKGRVVKSTKTDSQERFSFRREHDEQQKAAIAELRQMYPNAPVGLPEGADSAYSTYGRSVDCYLEIQVDRELIGPKRTDEVIKNKSWYAWIYKTILRDEQKISDVVDEHNLRIK